MGKVMYCERCGRVYHIIFSKKCNFCKNKMKLLPEELKFKYHIFVEDWSQTSDEEELLRKENFVLGELKDNPLFSLVDYKKQFQEQIELKQRLEEWEKQKVLESQAKNLAKMQKEKDKINCIPQCPICGSRNISKIGLVSRGVSTHFLGLASSKIGSTHKCNNCGTTW